MGSYKVEDSLEEFNKRYMESYHLTMEKIHKNLVQPSVQMKRGSSVRQQLSSPFICEDDKTVDCGVACKKVPKGVIFTDNQEQGSVDTDYKHLTQAHGSGIYSELSDRVAYPSHLKPSVIIASVNTINNNKPLSTTLEKKRRNKDELSKCYSKSKSQGQKSSPFIRQRKSKSTSSAPILKKSYWDTYDNDTDTNALTNSKKRKLINTITPQFERENLSYSPHQSSHEPISISDYEYLDLEGFDNFWLSKDFEFF